MFTREEALEFAFEGGLKGANFVHRWNGKLTVWYWEGRGTMSYYGSGPEDEPTAGRLAEALRDKPDGWFVSAKPPKTKKTSRARK